MKYTRLGATGMPVSRLCLGTMTFGFQIDEAQAFAIMNRAFDAGITFFDTADGYPLGQPGNLSGTTEIIIGKWMKGRREDIILATKCNAAMSKRPWDRGLSRKHILDAVEGSLRRLGTDYIDLYQFHAYDPETPMDESLRAMEDLVRAGKVRYAGCSNWLAYRIARSLGRSEAMGITRFSCVQPRYNLLFREIERELLPLCAEEGIGVIPYNPIAGGFLSGKHLRGTPTEGTRFTLGTTATNYQARYWHERTFDTVDALRPIAAEAGMPMVTLATSWVLANPAVTSPIIGASRPEQLDDLIAAIDQPLSPELKARLDDLTYEYRFGDAAR